MGLTNLKKGVVWKPFQLNLEPQSFRHKETHCYKENPLLWADMQFSQLRGYLLDVRAY